LRDKDFLTADNYRLLEDKIKETESHYQNRLNDSQIF